MSATTYRQAIIRGLADAMAADDDVFLLGEDVGVAGGAFKLTEGLFARFGPERVFDTPISSRRSSAPRSARRPAGCAPWRRSCSATLPRCASIRSPISSRNTVT